MPKPVPSPFRPGLDLENRYDLIERIREGGQAAVWHLKDRRFLERPTVAKLRYRPLKDRDDPKFVSEEAQLANEARLMGGKSNRFIMCPHDIIETMQEIDGVEFVIAGLTMDYATEGSLKDFTDSEQFKAFKILAKVEFLKNLAECVQALQEARIVHNDIKPQNFLVTLEGKAYFARIADLGFAYRLGEPPVFGGTRGYEAPEKAGKLGVAGTFASDIWALAIVFFEVITGEHPIEGIDSAEATRAMQAEAKALLDSQRVGDGFPRKLLRLIHNMAETVVEDRPKISAVLKEIDQILSLIRNDTFAHSNEIVPELAGRFAWDDQLHAAFSEYEQLVFVRTRGSVTNVRDIAERLEREEIYGFAAYRVLGDRDFLVRVWRPRGDDDALDAVLGAYEGDAKRVFTPTYRWPRASDATKARYQSKDEVMTLLQSISNRKTGEAAARSATTRKIIVGAPKRLREKEREQSTESRRITPQRHNVRAFSIVSAQKELPRSLVDTIAEKIWHALRKLPTVAQVEVMANPGGNNVKTEFVVCVELKNFHEIGAVLELIEKRIVENSEHVTPLFQTYFEMDAVPRIEAFDGNLLVELAAHRLRHDLDED